ncbi:MAG: hypothetical protein JWO47_279 [Candidatus Saccharibacteria bacterium]|nr:hypothetical protein [Candidatus Saccharibacteria bacterium]
MANEHLKTAASNIQRAVSDVRLLQSQIRAEMENTKRKNEQLIKDIHKQMAQLERGVQNPNMRDSDKLANRTKEQMLQAEISKIQAETEKYIRERNQQLHGLDGQATEFESLSTHLQQIA